jgi:glutathione S-transferase
MMILRSAPPSPFGRKVCIALSLLGLDRDVRVEAADTVDPHDSLREQNPLGKIPVLIAEDGSTFYDSRVILEFLDDRAGGKIIPREAGPRFAALRLQALCDGILDASILTVYEGRWRGREARAEVARSSGRKGDARVRGARSCSASARRRNPGCRSDRARLCAWLSGPPLWRRCPQQMPASCRLA